MYVVPAAELEPADQQSSGYDVAGASGDEGRLRSRRREDRDVPGHHDDIEPAPEVEVAEIGDEPGQVGSTTAGGRYHRLIGIDPDDVDPATVELLGNPPRPAPGIEDGRRSERHHKIGLAVHGNSGRGQRVEARLVLLAVSRHRPIITA